MEHETNKLLEEILTHPSFREWASGNAPELDCFWQEWTGNDPVRREVLQQAVVMLKAVSGNPLQLSDDHVRKKVREALEISRRMDSGRGTLTTKYHHSKSIGSYWRIAASLLLLIALGWTAYRYFDRLSPEMPVTETGPVMVTITNNRNLPRYVQLSDGSSVVLKEGSKLEYPVRFTGDRREVFLSGEAFFEITKNQASPFYVHTTRLVTKVLGTSFRVKAYQHDPLAEVAVKTGKVAVFARQKLPESDPDDFPEATATTLYPNEKVTFGLSEEGIKKPAETPEAATMPIEALSFQYNATPVTKVWNDLQKAYGIEIRYDHEQMKHCSVTAHLTDEPLQDKLKWVCTILEASYTLEDNIVRISSRPCQ